ncbi:MAG TPA: hypothetical protein VK879_09965 [Candidatus Sulfomarinibacteraceae bacterium]|nr:hypothetical protein [Candidatus Sulfomarinibacteraceae bacterium]
MKGTQTRFRLSGTWIAAGCLVIFICLGSLLLVGTAGYIVYSDVVIRSAATPVVAEDPAPLSTVPESDGAPLAAATVPPAPSNPLNSSALPTVLAPTAPAENKSLLDLRPPASIVQDPQPERSYGHLENLLLADYPVHDVYEASKRVGRQDVGPRTVTADPYQVGDRRTFYTDGGTTEATLLAVTEHTYFWVESDLGLDQAAVAAAAERFESEYYPRLVNLFGQEWRPGMDNDPHFSVLHLNYVDSGTDELGHFNSGDEYPQTLFSGSNEQEIIYLNMGNLTLGSDLYFGTLVHEFQHLVQWYVDANETAWLNEGLSQLAEIYVGLETADTVDYLLSPGTQLNAWDSAGENIYAHYGASYLFCVYVWEQLGEAAVRELARHPANGMASVNAILEGYRPDLTLEQFVSQWTVANYLDDAAVDPAYHYEALELRRPNVQTRVKYAPFETIEHVQQFGAHYVALELEGEAILSFAGDTLTPLAPASPYGGEQMWFAPAQENVNAQLTARFDLSAVDEATLTYWTWYDLKPGLDYAYVSASVDGGATWELLAPSHSRPGDYGPAYNGRSAVLPNAEKDGWIQESVTLDEFVGQPLLVRFELLTYYDSEGHGFALDDISIPQLEYMTDAEDGADGWQASGFVQTGAVLPQRWAVQYISHDLPAEVVVLELDDFNQGRWHLDLGTEGGALAITALTPFAYEPASFWLYVEQ